MKLFEPITIRKMEIKNRIVMAPMATNYPFRSEQSRSFYVERAKGGVGAITLGATNIDALFGDRFTKGVQEWIIDPVHEYGVKIGPELWHGNLSPSLPFKGVIQQWVAPSAGTPLGTRSISALVRSPSNCHCRELTISEIQDVIAKFARAAARAVEVGFDYVNIHAAHGHNLADQFFSPRDNRRTDIYGGDLAGRMRFGIELARAIRSAIGDYPFFWRLSAEHGLPGDYTLDEAVQYAAELAKAGVDVIDISYGHEEPYDTAPSRAMTVCPGSDEPMGTFISNVEAFKRRLFVPVIAVGRIHSFEVAEEILSQGKADMVAIGRQLLADPYWPQKVASGTFDDINPCQCCNTCILIFRHEQIPIRCVVNASLGKEEEYKIKPAEKVKKVLVVGGGPAGMEAARVAAQRGHKVTLIDKGDKLGGALLLIGKIPPKPTVNDLIKYHTRQLEKAGVQVRLNEEVSLKFVEEMKPDVVILATGSSHSMPDIPGLQKNNIITATDILSGPGEVGDKVAIIGGGLVGCDIAGFLATKGKKVTIIEVLPDIAAELYRPERELMCYRLGAKGVVMMSGVQHEEGTEGGLIVTDRWGVTYTIEADTIVIATGAKPNDGLFKELKGKVSELHSIGDCAEPRKIINAIAEGASVGRQI